MSKSKYITVTDPIGGIFMGDNSPVPVNHRVLFDGQAFYGYESLVKFFAAPSQTQQETYRKLFAFLTLIEAESTGTYDRFTWEHK